MLEVGWVWRWQIADGDIFIFFFLNSFAPHPLTIEQRAPKGKFSILAFAFLAVVVLCETSVARSPQKSSFFSVCSLSFSFFVLLFFLSFFFFTGFLKPQCSLAPPMQRGRSGEACSCFSGMCPLHQRRLSTGNTDCGNTPVATCLLAVFVGLSNSPE